MTELEKLFDEMLGGDVPQPRQGSGDPLEDLFYEMVEAPEESKSLAAQLFGVEQADIESAITPIAEGIAAAPGAAVEFVKDIPQSMAETPLQTAAGIGTGLAGGALSKAGPLGVVKRAMIDVPFQIAAKEAEELFGITEEDDSIWMNTAEALVEQLGAETGTLIMRKLGIFDKVPPEKLKPLLEDVPSPKDVGGLTATDVEKQLFGGEEIFTLQERTQKRGIREATRAAKAGITAKEIFFGDPERAKLFARNEKIQKEMTDLLTRANENPLADVRIKPAKVAEQLQSSAGVRLATMGEASDRALNFAGKMAKEAPKDRVFDAITLDSVIRENEAVIKRSIGDKQYDKLLSKLDTARINNVIGVGTRIEGNISAKDFFDITEGLLATFSDKQERAVFLSKVWPKLSGVLESGRGSSADAFVDSYTRANNGYITTSHLRNSPAFKAMENATEQSLRNIFKNPSLYKSVVETAKQAGGEAWETLPRVLDTFAMDEMLNPATKEVEYSLVEKFMKEFGRENVRNILGADRLKQIDMLGSAAFMLEQNNMIKNLARSSTAVEEIQQVAGDLGRNFAAAHRIGGGAISRGTVSGPTTFLSEYFRKKFNITDKGALKKAMRSSAGTKFLEENMTNPRSYPLYVNLMRELGIKPVSRDEYDSTVDEFIADNPLFSADGDGELPSMEELMRALDEERMSPTFIPEQNLQVEEFKSSNPLPEEAQIREDEGGKFNEAGEAISYRDNSPEKHLTGGVGHLLTAEEQKKYPEGTTIPKEVVDAWFAKDMEAAIADVESLVPGVDGEVKNILTNMAFNLGRGRLSGFTELLKAVKKGDFEKAADEMINSKWYGQVRGRSKRLVERMRRVGK